MCTAAAYKTKDFYFGRTLDYEIFLCRPGDHHSKELSLPLPFSGTMETHYAMIGHGPCG